MKKERLTINDRVHLGPVLEGKIVRILCPLLIRKRTSMREDCGCLCSFFYSNDASLGLGLIYSFFFSIFLVICFRV